MKAHLRSRPWRSLLLLSGAASVVALSSCMDREPIGPTQVGPLFTEAASTTLSGSGTATVDGTIGLVEWQDADCRDFTVPLSGGGNDGRETEARLCAMHDAANWYWSLRLQDPGNNAGSILSILLRSGPGALRYDEILWNSGYFDHYRDSPAFASTSDGPDKQHGSVVRSGAGGVTSFEGFKPRNSNDQFDLLLNGTVEFQLYFEQQGRSIYYPSSTGWAQYDFGGTGGDPNDDPNIPNLYVTVTVPVATLLPCGGTVGLRSADDQQVFHVAQALWNGFEYVATFIDVQPSDIGYIPSVHNVCDDDPTHWNTWPIPDFNTTEDLGNFDGTVYNWDDETFYIAIPDNYHNAVTAARNNPLTADTEITLALLKNERGIVECTLTGAMYPALVFSAVLLDPSRIPAFTSADPPAWGIHGDKVNSSAPGECQQKGLFLGAYIIGEALDSENKIFRTLVGPEDNTATYYPGSNFSEVSYILGETWGDAHPLDIGLVSFGLIDGTRTLGIDAVVRGLNPKGLARYQFEVILNPGPTQLTIRWTAECNPARDEGKCRLQEVQPKKPARTVSVGGAVNSRGEGTVSGYIALNPGDTVVHLRVLSGDKDGDIDRAPDRGYAVWTGNGGGSVFVPF